MWAMRADRGSKMLAATVQVGRESTWRNRSRACDIMGPPFPLGPCPQSNLTPDLFSRDLHRDSRTSGFCRTFSFEPTFKGVWYAAMNFALLSLLDTRPDHCLRPHSRSAAGPGRPGRGGFSYVP